MSRYSNLVKTVNMYQPKSILEVGTWNGVNAGKMICEALRYHSSVKYLGFDLFENFKGLENKEFCPKVPAKFNEVLNKLSAIKGADVTLIWGNTHKTIPMYILDDTRYDLIYIDGGHSLETITADWENCQRFVHDKTVFLLDDYYYDNELSKQFGCSRLIEQIWQKNAGKIAIDFLQPVDKCNGGTAMVKIVSLV